MTDINFNIPTKRPNPDTPSVPKHAPAARNDAEYLSYLRSLYMTARKAKSSRKSAWDRNYKIINNRYQSAQFAPYAPQPRDSELYPICSSLVAWMTDQEPDVGFTPAADPSSQYYKQIGVIADDLNNVMQTTWMVEEYDRQYKIMLWDGLVCGTGLIKSIWDNAAADGAGDAIVKRVDPYSFFPDPNATCLDECEFMVEVRQMSYEQIARCYPDTAYVMLSGTTDTADQRPLIYGGNSTIPTANLGFLPSGNGLWSNRPVGGGPPSATLYTVYEYWLKENTYEDYDLEDQSPGINAYAIPRWKCVVVCAGNILFEEWADDLWTHACHPYDEWRFDDIGEFWGVSLVDHLSLPQLYINRLLTALQQNSELCGNPIFVEAANQGTARSNITNRPGERLTVNGSQASANLPRWLTPPSMPSQVMDLINFWISRIENTAGINGMQKGQDPSQRVSNNTVNSVQEAAFVRIRSALTNLGWTYRRSASKLASLIAQNYTEQRIVAIVGPKGVSTSLSLRPFHFYDPSKDGSEPLRFIIRADAGSNQATSRQARVAQANTLFSMQVVDDEYVLNVNGIRDAQEILERKYYKMQNGLIGGASGPSARQRAKRNS